MREHMIRLVSTAIYHFKNVSYGKIEMPCAVGRDFSCDRRRSSVFTDKTAPARPR